MNDSNITKSLQLFIPDDVFDDASSTKMCTCADVPVDVLSLFLSFVRSTSRRRIYFLPSRGEGTEGDMKGIVNQKQTPSYPYLNTKYASSIRLSSF